METVASEAETDPDQVRLGSSPFVLVSYAESGVKKAVYVETWKDDDDNVNNSATQQDRGTPTMSEWICLRARRIIQGTHEYPTAKTMGEMAIFVTSRLGFQVGLRPESWDLAEAAFSAYTDALGQRIQGCVDAPKINNTEVDSPVSINQDAQMNLQEAQGMLQKMKDEYKPIHDAAKQNNAHDYSKKVIQMIDDYHKMVNSVLALNKKYSQYFSEGLLTYLLDIVTKKNLCSDFSTAREVSEKVMTFWRKRCRGKVLSDEAIYKQNAQKINEQSLLVDAIPLLTANVFMPYVMTAIGNIRDKATFRLEPSGFAYINDFKKSNMSFEASDDNKSVIYKSKQFMSGFNTVFSSSKDEMHSVAAAMGVATALFAGVNTRITSFGYSGVGKTSVLMGRKDGLDYFQGIMGAVINSSIFPSPGKTLSFRLKETYGIRIGSNMREFVFYFNAQGRQDNNTNKASIADSRDTITMVIKNIISASDAAEEIRKNKGSCVQTIKLTKNNPQSSRSIMSTMIEIDSSDEANGDSNGNDGSGVQTAKKTHLEILDLPGMEDVIETHGTDVDYKGNKISLAGALNALSEIDLYDGSKVDPKYRSSMIVSLGDSVEYNVECTCPDWMTISYKGPRKLQDVFLENDNVKQFIGFITKRIADDVVPELPRERIMGEAHDTKVKHIHYLPSRLGRLTGIRIPNIRNKTWVPLSFRPQALIGGYSDNKVCDDFLMGITGPTTHDIYAYMALLALQATEAQFSVAMFNEKAGKSSNIGVLNIQSIKKSPTFKNESKQARGKEYFGNYFNFSEKSDFLNKELKEIFKVIQIDKWKNWHDTYYANTPGGLQFADKIDSEECGLKITIDSEILKQSIENEMGVLAQYVIFQNLPTINSEVFMKLGNVSPGITPEDNAKQEIAAFFENISNDVFDKKQQLLQQIQGLIQRTYNADFCDKLSEAFETEEGLSTLEGIYINNMLGKMFDTKANVGNAQNVDGTSDETDAETDGRTGDVYNAYFFVFANNESTEAQAKCVADNSEIYQKIKNLRVEQQ